MDALQLSYELNGDSLGPAARLLLNEDELMQLAPAIDMAEDNDTLAFL